LQQHCRPYEVFATCWSLLIPRKNRTFESRRGRNGSINMESLLDLYPGFMELGNTRKVAFLSAEVLNLYLLP
jgi:hypothetical protein